MVDTLAPKRIFTQRELDQKLTPVTEQVLRTRPRERLLDVVPRITTEPSLLNRQTEEAMQDSKKQTGQIMTEEQGQTAKSSEETRKEKQTGMKVDTEAERGQGLVMRPMEYAAKGYDDKEVSGPILVGEKGPEMIVPTGNGKISVLPNSIVQGMMSKPMKKAEKGMDNIGIGGLVKRGIEKVKKRFAEPTEEEIQEEIQRSREAEIIRDKILLQMEEKYGFEDMKKQAEMGLINDGGRYTDPDFVAPSEKYGMDFLGFEKPE
tara:strand:+ start:159 stop:944 length:786 start_codon:yes stop_codon:yes gene_type:complete